MVARLTIRSQAAQVAHAAVYVTSGQTTGALERGQTTLITWVVAFRLAADCELST
jgi:hypothetical protein